MNQSVFEWCRFSTTWWLDLAEKARFVAFLLSSLTPTTLDEVRSRSEYSGIAKLAVSDGFFREAARALELIIKCVLAERLEHEKVDPAKSNFPENHDLLKLWKKANLPNLSIDDESRLLLCKYRLTWVGRYPTPKKELDYEKMEEEFRNLRFPDKKKGELVIEKTIKFSFEDFDRLYKIAKNHIQLSKYKK